VKAAIRKRAKDFFAIIALFLIALLVGSYILSNQRLTLPGWVPGIGKSFFVLKAEFSTAQAVTPGQGQTVNIAGVKVGEIKKVNLVDGRAVVTMNIDKKYGTVYRNASMLLRPKTGLKDMIVELTPGSPTAGKLKSGATVPIQNTLPDINPDEILSALDGDTRDYLQLLVSGAGTGLRQNASPLAAAIKRFEPTARDTERITAALDTRRANLSRFIHNFQLLSTELAGKDRQITNFVDSSNDVFAAFAAQDANLRSTLRELPPSLRATNVGLGKAETLANQLGPTLQALRPTARALGPTLVRVRPFLRESTPIIRDKIRPFTRVARPITRRLRPTAANLSALTPNLVKTTKVINYALNELAYNPPGPADEGYLFYFSWANHIGATLFGTQDAHGPVRRGVLLASCSTLDILQQIASANKSLAALTQLANPPLESQVCPTSAQGDG
jgi:phospholipid/cholesterol/gamma-HCH transport system substrate-binding protein